MLRMLVPVSILLLAGCARTEDASTVPAEEGGYNRVEEVRSSDAEDQELALGEWRPSLQNELRALEFGPNGTEPLFSMLCGDNGAVILQRHGTVPVGGLEMMTVSVGGQARQVQATAAAGTVPMLRAEIATSEPLLGELTGAQGPITMRLGDGAPLILPPSPLIGQFVRSCSGGPQLRPVGPALPGIPELGNMNDMQPANEASGNEAAGNEAQPSG